MSGTVGLLGLPVCLCVCASYIMYSIMFPTEQTTGSWFIMQHSCTYDLQLVYFAVFVISSLFKWKTSPLPAGVNTATAPSASPPTCNVTFATSTTRKSPSSATCVIVASVSRPTWTVTSRSTRMATCQVRSLELIYLVLWSVERLLEFSLFFFKPLFLFPYFIRENESITIHCIYKSFCWIR